MTEANKQAEVTVAEITAPISFRAVPAHRRKPLALVCISTDRIEIGSEYFLATKLHESNTHFVSND